MIQHQCGDMALVRATHSEPSEFGEVLAGPFADPLLGLDWLEDMLALDDMLASNASAEKGAA